MESVYNEIDACTPFWNMISLTQIKNQTQHKLEKNRTESQAKKKVLTVKNSDMGCGLVEGGPTLEHYMGFGSKVNSVE